MTDFRPIKTPHLPQGRVGLLALGERYAPALAEPLLALGVEPLWLPDNLLVDNRVAGHADLALLHLGDERVVAAKGSGVVNLLTNRGFAVTESDMPPAGDYPGDCGLCGCLVGRTFLHNLTHSDSAVLRRLKTDTTIHMVHMVHIAQGYAKCAICVVDAQSILTSDAGVAKAAEAHGLDVLRVRPGFVELPGFAYGFLGGAAFQLRRSELAFTGTLDGHPDKERILAFLRDRGVTARYLTHRPVFDIGSAVPLTQDNPA